MTRIKIDLAFWGDGFNPQSFSSKINIVPTKFWNKGERIRSSNLFHNESMWIYSTGFLESFNLEYVSESFLKLFHPQLDKIKDAINTFKLECKLEIVTDIVDENKPSLFFDKKMVSFISELNGTIDIDIYLS